MSEESYYQRRYRKLKEKGLCVDCGKELALPGHTRGAECQKRTSEGDRRRTRERTAKLKKAGLCIECGLVNPAEGKAKCLECIEASKARVNASNDRLREEIFQAYGGYICWCCGKEKHPHFMQMDHFNNDGAKHRREIFGESHGKASTKYYRWLRKNSFPLVVKPICGDCHVARSTFGVCPCKGEGRTP